MVIKYPIDIYPKEVLIKAAFRFLDQAYIHIDKENDNYIVTITPKEEDNEISQGEFDNEMLAQAARYAVFTRTKAIREITLGRAMASTIIDNNINEEYAEVHTDVDDILKDWFDK